MVGLLDILVGAVGLEWMLVGDLFDADGRFLVVAILVWFWVGVYRPLLLDAGVMLLFWECSRHWLIWDIAEDLVLYVWDAKMEPKFGV